MRSRRRGRFRCGAVRANNDRKRTVETDLAQLYWAALSAYTTQRHTNRQRDRQADGQRERGEHKARTFNILSNARNRSLSYFKATSLQTSSITEQRSKRIPFEPFLRSRKTPSPPLSLSLSPSLWASASARAMGGRKCDREQMRRFWGRILISGRLS